MTRSLLLALALGTCAPAHAATIDTWSGAGPNACHGTCDLEWFRGTLTPEEQAALQEAIDAQPEPGPIMVQDGDVFSVMSYQEDGQPVSYRTSTVAALHSPTYGEGWVLDGYTVVKLADCQNWAIIVHGQHVPVFSAPPAYIPSMPPVFDPAPPADDPWEPCCVTYTPPETPQNPTPPAIPLPAPLVLMLTALGSLGLLSWRT